MGGRSRPTARMRLSGESVKVEKHEKAVMFVGEHDGIFIAVASHAHYALVIPAKAGIHWRQHLGRNRDVSGYGLAPARA